ncbi:hypothetical protein ACOSP7_000861 [Xanthoceras sorbifolium]
MSHKKHQIAIMPSPGMGHLIPLVELAKQLVLRHDFSVTFIVPTIGPPPKELMAVLQELPDQGMNFVLLPPVNFEEGVKNETQIVLTIIRSLASIRDVFKSLVEIENTRLVAFVVDIFGTNAFDVAVEFKIPSYIYYITNAMCLSFVIYSPKLDEMVSCEFRDMPEPIKIPGFSIPVPGRDLPEPLQDRKHETYKQMIQVAKSYSSAQGIMINTFMDLEPGVIRALQEGEQSGIPPIYPIGPLIQSGSSGGADGSECVRWLDDQARGSVLFVSFGSGGTLSRDQLNELALGLELSGHKFLWIVRSPNDKSANSAYFTVQSKSDPLGFLPTGFLNRTKKRGLVVPSWAPQIRVLSHGSTGGFLTHCGWNSILESIVNGVPLIAWPLFAEQKMNALMLVEDLKVALRPKSSENGLVGREEIAKVVKGLMGGEAGATIRDRMNMLKESAAKALSEDGSSTIAISELVLKLKN